MLKTLLAIFNFVAVLDAARTSQHDINQLTGSRVAEQTVAKENFVPARLSGPVVGFHLMHSIAPVSSLPDPPFSPTEGESVKDSTGPPQHSLSEAIERIFYNLMRHWRKAPNGEDTSAKQPDDHAGDLHFYQEISKLASAVDELLRQDETHCAECPKIMEKIRRSLNAFYAEEIAGASDRTVVSVDKKGASLQRLLDHVQELKDELVALNAREERPLGLSDVTNQLQDLESELHGLKHDLVSHASSQADKPPKQASPDSVSIDQKVDERPLKNEASTRDPSSTAASVGSKIVDLTARALKHASKDYDSW